MRHNKKRNVALVYECLIRQLTKVVISEDKKQEQEIVSILKEFFSKNRILNKEKELYTSLLETKNISKDVAEKILQEAKKQYKKLSTRELFDEQSKFIDKVNKSLGKDIYSNFIPNYTSLATINQILGDALPAKKKVMLEEVLLQKMISPETENKKDSRQAINPLAYKVFVKKFNESYSNGSLLPEQKDMLMRYMASGEKVDIDFKIYLNEEVSRLEQVINSSLLLKEVKDDKEMSEKTNGVLTLIESFKTEKNIDEKMLKNVMKLQQLANEIQSNDH